jgi:adenylate cyclase
MGADEEGTLEHLKSHIAELIDPKIRERHGRIVKTTGDGLLAEFASVVDAVRCAGEIQSAMADRDLDLADERRLRFRIGINLGDVIADGDDIYGDGVNIAARLEALAEPGGVCVSATVRDHIGDRLPYAFTDMGEQSVKNIARPVRAYALRPKGVAALRASGLPAQPSRRGRVIIGTVAAAALVIVCVALWFWPAATFFSRAGKPADQATASATRVSTAPATTSISQPLVAPRLSIIVLPFANLSTDPDQQYFADGITEDLTTDLSRLAGTLVISHNTAFNYRNKPVDAKQIGRELGVRYVLEGSVRRSGNQVRVTAQLIDAETDAHLWAERFDRDTGDLFAVGNEITSRIAVELSTELVGAEAARPTDNPGALDYILRGRAVNKPASRDTYAEIVGLFERALALDPRSVEAQSRLALALANRVLDQMTDSAAVDMERAEGLIRQALAASPRFYLPHFAKAQVLRQQGRCAEAILEYETVIALYRNWAAAYSHLGWCKFLTGLLEEAIPAAQQTIRLNPRDPNGNGVPCMRIGLVHLLQSRTDEAILWLEKGRSAMPEHPSPHVFLASAYALRGETERAATELADARRLVGDDRYSSIARYKAVAGANFGVPKVRALFEATYFAGLRKAGMPEE